MERSYSGAWRRYRGWSWTFWLAFLGYLPGMALLWMVLVGAIGYRKFNFTCPRCGELFFRAFDPRPWRQDWRHNPFARRCLHCGLPKWAAAG